MMMMMSRTGAGRGPLLDMPLTTCPGACRPAPYSETNMFVHNITMELYKHQSIQTMSL